jgi:hypothetical protein
LIAVHSRVVSLVKVISLGAFLALTACVTLPDHTTPSTAPGESELVAESTTAAGSLLPNHHEQLSFAALQDKDHLNQATAFLNGASESCFTRSHPWECVRWPFLHPRPGSLIQHLHRDSAILDYSPYYYDKLLHSGSDDLHQGWEGANVIFYAGHGSPIGWGARGYNQAALGGNPSLVNVPACLDKTRIGDGEARYLLMLSCYVMAHGPRGGCASNPNSFGCPEKFFPHAPALQSAQQSCVEGFPGFSQEILRDHHNVFARWRTHMSPRLRLACGGSTVLPTSGAPGRFWQTHAVQGLPVADSFLLSLSDFKEVPMCLTTGNGLPQNTPLYDQEFVPDENLKQEGTYMYAMFPVRGTPVANLVAGLLTGIVETDGSTDNETTEDDWAPPILEVARPALPNWLATVAGSPTVPRGEFGFKRVPSDVIAGLTCVQPPLHEAITLQIHPRSGALKIRWQPSAEPPSPSLTASFSSLFDCLGLQPRALLTGGEGLFKAAPVGSSLTLQIDRVVAATATTAGPEHFQKCVYGRLDPRVKVAGPRIDDGAPPGPVSHVLPVFSLGSEWLLQICPSGPDSTPGIGGMPLALAGNGEISLSLMGRKVVEAHRATDLGIAPLRTRPVAREVAWNKLADQIGVSVAEAKEDFATPTDELGYLAAPSHCRQTHMYPIYRFTFQRRPSVPEVLESPIEIDVSVYGPGMAFASEEWVCDPQFPL